MSFRIEGQHEFAPGQMVTRYIADNGLRVLHCKRGKAPVLTFELWYQVGSKHEKKGHTGMAHLFEHLMFHQTKHLSFGEFDRIIEGCGGDSNAATWVDWTYYRDSIPTWNFDKICSVEADRMCNLTLTQTILDKEREVVINERIERVDDDIDGFMEEECFRRAFQTHPYHWPTIGWLEDLRSIDLESVRSFYREHYAPNNTVLVVVGNIEANEMLSTLDKHFASIPPSEKTSVKLKSEAQQPKEIRASFRKTTSTPRLLWGHKSPAQSSKDWPLLWFASSILAGSSSSRLHRRLVIENEIASNVDCHVLPFADPSLMLTSVSAMPNSSLVELEKTMMHEIDGLAAEGPSEDELNKTRNLIETEYWLGLETNTSIAEALGHYESTTSGFENMFNIRDHIQNISSADIKDVVDRYLRAPATKLTVEPI